MTEGVQKLSFTCEKGEFSVNFLESGEVASPPGWIRAGKGILAYAS